MAMRLAEALEAMHQAQAYHGDISHNNVFLQKGDCNRTMLGDLGVAGAMGQPAWPEMVGQVRAATWASGNSTAAYLSKHLQAQQHSLVVRAAAVLHPTMQTCL